MHENTKASQIDCRAKNTVTRKNGDQVFFHFVFEKYKSSLV